MLIASSSHDLKLHTIDTGELAYAYKTDKTTAINHLAWSKEGRWISVIPSQGNAQILSLSDSKFRSTHIVQNIREPTCSSFQLDPSGKRYLTLGTASGLVLTYDVKSKKVIRKYPRVDTCVTSIDYCANGSHLVSGCSNGEIVVFNAQSQVKSSVFKVPSSKVLTSVKCHKTARHLVGAGTESGIVAVWDLNKGTPLYCTKVHAAPVTDVTFIKRHDVLLSIGMDRVINFIDHATQTIVSQIPTDTNMTSIDVNSDGISVVLGSEKGFALFYDIRNIKTPTSIIKCHEGAIKQIFFQPAGKVTSDSQYSFNEMVNSSFTAHETSNSNKQDSFLEEFRLSLSLNNSTGKADNSLTTKTGLESDSFMDAIGFVSNTSLQTSTGMITKEVTSLLESVPNLLVKIDETVEPLNKSSNTENPDQPDNTTVGKTRSSKLEDRMTSTPKFLTSGPGISPMISSNRTGGIGNNDNIAAGLSKEAVGEIVRDIVREETGKIRDEILNELKYELKNVSRLSYTQGMDRSLTNFIEFMKIEDTLSEVRNLLVRNSVGDDDNIYQDYFALKQENARLNEELKKNNP